MGQWPILPISTAIISISSLGSSKQLTRDKLITRSSFQPSKSEPKFMVEIREGQSIAIHITNIAKNKTQIIDISAYEIEDVSNAQIKIGDFNFDNNLDFAIQVFRGATGNDSHLYFLYHPEDSSFRIHPEWEKLSHAQFFPMRKQIHCHWNAGHAGGDRTEVLFQVNGYELIKLITKEYLDGKLVSNIQTNPTYQQ